MIVHTLPTLADPRFVLESISWERVLLHLTVCRRPSSKLEAHDPQAPTLTFQDGTQEFSPFVLHRADEAAHLLHTRKVDENRWILTINVTNFENRAALDDGTWRIAGHDESGWHRLACSLDLVPHLDDSSRSFLHARNTRAYVVEPGIGEADTEFLLRTYFFTRTPRTSVSDRVWRLVRRMWKSAKRSCLIGVYRVSLAAHPHREKTILFASEARPNIQGNLRTIRNRMRERGLDSQFTILTSFRTEAMSNRKSAFTLAWLMGSSGTLIIDDYFVLLDSFPVDGHHTIIQAWHAGSGFKDVGYSRFGKWGSPNLSNAHRHYTYAICGSQALRDVYSEVFGIERDAVIPTGLPRIDDFLDPERIEAARKLFAHTYPGAVAKRVLLFAPTFRGKGMADGYYDWDQIDWDALYEGLGTDSVLLIRQHHFVIDPAPIPENMRDRIIDASGFPDTNDLLHSADVLITDYSSIIYEFSLLERPMIFFAYDLDMYAATRGLHRDYRASVPGEVARSCDELLSLLTAPTLDREKTRAFREENFDYTDRGNADRFIDWFLLGHMPDTFDSLPSSDSFQGA